MRMLFLAVIALVAAVCLRLGFWQLDRLQERRTENRIAEAARALPEVPISGAAGPSLAHRRVRATGVYDPRGEIILRGQSHRERPGVVVVTPLRLAGRDTAVLVARGFVPSADAVSVSAVPAAEPGEVTVRGIALPLGERDDDGAMLERPGLGTTWKGLDRSAIEARLGYPVATVYLVQAPDSAAAASPRRLEPPALDDGPHLSYAIQWFAFAVIALVGAAALLGRRGSAARRPVP
ncbi:MAG: SURF1 family protein [Gemmatimonadota bacterium]